MMLGIARAALFAVVPAELLLVVLLASGVALPGPLVVSAEAAVVAVAVLEIVTAYRLFRDGRRGGSDRRTALRAAVHRLVPVQVRRIVGFELKGLVSLVLWAGRRRDGVPPGAVAVPYAREGLSTLLLLVFVMVIEAVGTEVLLRALGVPVGPRTVVLVVDVYAVVAALAMGATWVTRPHVLDAAELRIRMGAFVDLRVPRPLISSVRLARNDNEPRTVGVEDGCLALAVSSRTNVVVELSETVTAVRPLGSTAEVGTVRFFADSPRAVVAALAAGRRGGPVEAGG